MKTGTNAFVKALALSATVAVTITACSEPNTAQNAQQSGSMKSSSIAAPIAKKVPHEMTQHGHTRVDNYYWMRDDTRTDKEILAHLEAENDYVKANLSHTEALQTKLFEEMKGRFKKDDSSVPFLKNGYWFSRKYEGEAEYPVHVRKKDGSDQEEVLLDVNELAKGHDYFNVSRAITSPNNKLLAYSSDSVGRRIYDLQFKDIESGKLLDDKLENTQGGIVWANDNQHVFYIKKHPQTLLGYQVYRHKLGTTQEQDVLMYEEDDDTFYTSIGKTRDDSMVYIFHGSTTTVGMSYLDANNPKGEFKTMAPLKRDLEYSFEKRGDEFYILTNHKAKNFKVVKANIADSNDLSKWQDVIPHDPEVFIEDVVVFDDYLITEERKNGLAQIRVMELATGKQKMIPFNDPVYVARLSTNVEMSTDKLRVYYSSLTTPGSVMDYNLNDLTYEVKKQDEVLGEFDPAWYGSERIFVKARDGKSVPVSLVYRKDMFKKDGTNPIYQYAYGSYGATMDPYFSASRLTLLDRGFVFVLAHIRGSQMLGREWYEDGKMFNKINTFTDFIDVTKALTKQGYGAKDKVFAVGGSAGGLLMGAVVNMAPELYLGVGAHVPFVDVVTTMSDASIPLTTGEYDEWGNPANKDSYEYMLSYSPYDQVKAQDYPNMLVTTGLHDSQVQYFEPMKWVAKLREFKTDDNLLLFNTNMEAGHGGSSGRFRYYKERALEYGFFMDLVDIKE